MTDKLLIEKVCADCRFWKRFQGPGAVKGQCRVKSPRFFAMVDIEMDWREKSAWPTTVADDWCGEWELMKQETTCEP